MYKYAEVKYGKIQNIFEDFRTIENWKEIHSPDKYWIDVTNLDVKVGDVLDFKEGVGLVILKSVDNSFESLVAFKLNGLKNSQYQENQAPIEYDFKFYDYDRQSKWKLLEKIYYMEVNGVDAITWKTFDNELIRLTLRDLKGIIAKGSERTDLLHIKYNTLKDMVNKCQTIEELNNVEW